MTLRAVLHKLLDMHNVPSSDPVRTEVDEATPEDAPENGKEETANAAE